MANSVCCCGSSHCSFATQYTQTIADLKQDLKVAAQAGMQLLRQGQEAEDSFRGQLEELSAENARLSVQNVQLLTENTEHAQRHLEAERKAADLESALVAARGRAQQLKSYHSLALALEEQVTALEALRASLEAERDSALADSAAYERKWRASQQLSQSVQNAFEALEASIANAPIFVQPPAASTPRRSLRPLTPDTSLDTRADTSVDISFDTTFNSTAPMTPLDDSLARELRAFEMRPKLRRAASHESVLAPPIMPKPQPMPYAPLNTAAPAGISVAAPEVVVVSGLRSGTARGSARGFLGSFRR